MNVNYKMLSAVLILVIAYQLFNRAPAGGTEGSAMDKETATLAVIHERASVRSFTDEAISEEDLTEIVKAGMAAPTAGNVQPWEFVVLTNRDEIPKYAGINQYAQMSHEAAAAIVVLLDKRKYAEKPHMMGYWAQDCAAVTQNMLLAITAKGLGAVWTGVYTENTEYGRPRVEGVTDWLDLPEQNVPFCVILLGHPKGEVHPKDKWDASRVTFKK